MIFLFISISIQASSFQLETFNTGLTGSVDYSNERIDPILDALSKSQSDVICLQELWDTNDRDKFISTLKGIFPHSYYVHQKSEKINKKPACFPWHVFGKNKIFSCTLSQCKGVPSKELGSCVSKKCNKSMTELVENSQQCAAGLFSQVGIGLNKVLMNIFNPIVATDKFAYRGNSGLMLLSKYPLKNRTLIDFSKDSTLVRRQALVADVIFSDAKVKVACTHLTADLSNVPYYSGTYESWLAENKAQMKQLFDSFQSVKAPLIILGDFNAGPELVNGKWINDQNNGYSPDIVSGYQDPAVLLTKKCTWCKINSLVGKNDQKDEIIDHVFIKNMTVVSGEIIYNRPIVLKSGIKTYLSDHYGYKVILKK